jgi:diguanylate cyclase (GGDEF)-like protein/PAS domain S-box-containing protein
MATDEKTPKTPHELLSFIKKLKPPSQFHLLSSTIEHCPITVVVADSQGDIKYANTRFAQLTGYTVEEILKLNLNFFYPGKQNTDDYKKIWNTITAGEKWAGEFRLRKKNGELFWGLATLKPLLNPPGQISYYLCYLEDITVHKRSEQLIEHLAFYDPLTGLPNRSLFNDRLKLALEEAHLLGHQTAVALLDLDRFKVINDTLGHIIGDQLLQLVAKRLSENLQEGDTLARMGQDEFIVLFPHINNFREALNRIKTLMEALQEPFLCENHELQINASIGICLYPEDGEDHMSLLKNADTALNEAKNSGRNHYKFYTSQLNASALKRLSMETAMRHALEREEFQVYYQPQVSLRTGRITGMEALLRWQHPTTGMIMPDQFIPLAEETGMIVPIGKWVLRTACLQNIAWQNLGFPPLRIGVNLSGRQFQEPELVEMVLDVCHQTGMDPRLLELELTESILMKDVSVTSMILRWLNKKGIKIAIDDFGTGYSSLTYLKRFPINTLKIDRSFVKECLTNTDDTAIVTTITYMAHSLKVKVTAEGVEDEKQLDFLTNLGCDEFQGYLFSRPIPAPEFTALLKDNRCLSRPHPLSDNSPPG